MRGPICIAKGNTIPGGGMKARTFYWTRGSWKRLAHLNTFRRYDSIVYGTESGIELNIGKLHIEVQTRSENY